MEARARLAVVALLGWLSLAEWRLMERLLFATERAGDVAFVLLGVGGVLDGHPVCKAWQQRFLGPLAVSGLERLTGNRQAALALFLALAVAAANALLYLLLRRGGAGRARAVVGVVLFGFAHLLTLYKLEYPWDAVDVLLFLAFGDAGRRGRPLGALWPLLAIGLVNHETILYLPLWALLAPLEGAGRRREALWGLAAGALLVGGIVALRAAFFHGFPTDPGLTIEEHTPLVDNPVHLAHNLSWWLVHNWRAGHATLSLGLLGAFGWLAVLAARPARRRAAVWSLAVLVSIVCFGYTNETRHYLPLLAFWAAYWPARDGDVPSPR